MAMDGFVARYCRAASRSGLGFTLASLVVLCVLTGSGARAATFEPLEIKTKTGGCKFSVEMATTEEEKTTGLMYRRELAPGRGMLFDFSPDQQVNMWMKNTFISLDMIFIRADGSIRRIAENTEPQSTRMIYSMGEVKGVLEVIAGTARKCGIAPDDRVVHPLFGGK
jgi:uncharacterized membrane protein (UPF0127 family)